MSTPPAKATAPRDPFGLLKAILIGLVLGFIAVMLVPYLLPAHDGQRRMASGPASTPQQPAEKVPVSISPPPRAESDGSNAKVSPEKAKSPEIVNAPPVVSAKSEQRDEPPSEAPRADDVKAPAPVENEEVKFQVPAAPEVAKDTPKAEPVLVPAVKVSFPKTFSDKDMTVAVQPLLSFKISDDDAAAIKEVISAASKGDDSAARAAIKK